MAHFALISLFDTSFEFISFSLLAFAVRFILSTMVVTSHSAFTSSSASSLSTEQADLQSRLREAEAFIHANSPGNAPEALSKAPSFPLNLGGSGMVLPNMRVASTCATVGFDVRVVANSGKSVDKRDGLMNFNPTFGGLTASDFASCVAGGKITASMDERDSLMFDDNEYSRNVTSLDG